jgi:hypothetical protein
MNLKPTISTALTTVLAGALAGPWVGAVAPAIAAIKEPDRWQAPRVMPPRATFL